METNAKNPISIQEEQYTFPYHWSLKPSSYQGRVYWGYLNTAMEMAGDIYQKKVLDAGCGDGMFSSLLYKKGADVVGVDFSDKAITFAKTLLPSVNFVKTSIESLPFSNNSFDKIFLIETLEHFPPEKIFQILSELRRVLKNEGVLIITTPSHLLPKSPKHYQHFSEQSLKETLSNYFSIEKIVGNDRKSFLWKNIYRLVDNRFFEIKALRKFFNLDVYPQFLQNTPICDAQRLIVQCKANYQYGENYTR